MTKEQEQVLNILLMPIECTTQKTLNIFKHNNRIFSSQMYKGLDPDMSDFAVEFYKIIYSDILTESEKQILVGAELKSKEFCGDTMNSYNTVAKRMRDDKVKNEWSNRYHCLANFWLLPMHVGHSSRYTSRLKLMKYSKTKNGINDYMDLFLRDYLANYNNYKEKFPEYSKKFTRENFAKNHFLEESYIKDGEIDFFSNIEADNIPNKMWDKIQERAKCITDRKEAELYKLLRPFQSLCKLKN